MGTEIKLESPINSPKEANRSQIITFVNGAFISLVGKLGTRGFSLIAQIILARILGPELFGLYAIGLIIYQIGAHIGLMGLTNGVIQFGTKSWNRDKSQFAIVVRHSLVLTLANSILICFFLISTASWASTYLFHQPELLPVIQGFAITVAFSINLQVASAISRISQRIQYSVISEDFLPSLTNLLLVILFVFILDLKLAGAISALTIGFLIGWIFARNFNFRIYYDKFLQAPLSIETFRKLLKFSIPTSLAGILSMLLFGSTTLLVGYFLSPIQVGIYQVAAQTAILSNIILTAFNSIFAPMITDLFHAQQFEKMNEIFKVSTKWGLYIGLPLSILFMLKPHIILSALYGQNYAGGLTAFVILTIAQLINLGTGSVGFLLIMTNRQNDWLYISSFSVVVTILLNILLIPGWGIEGAAIANATGIVILFVTALLRVRKKLRLWPFDARYIKSVIAGIVAAIASIFVGYLSPNNIYIQIIFMIVASYGSFFTILSILGLDYEDKLFVQHMSTMISSNLLINKNTTR